MSTDKLWTVISGIEYQLNILKDKLKSLDEETKQSIDDAYQRGLEDAWEAAKKIADMWTRIDNDELLAIFGITERIGHSTIRAMFEKQTANEAMLELEAYEEKQKTDNCIDIGDEVKWEGVNFTVLRVFTPKGCYEQCDGFDCDGNGYTNILTKDVTKTNRHFDISSILKEMQS